MPMLPILLAGAAALDRRALLGAAGAGAGALARCGCALAVAADAPGASGEAPRERLLAELASLLASPAPPPIGADDARAARIDAVLDALRACNPTPRPGSVQSFAPLAGGTWRVAFAPHIAKLSAAVGLRFDPILYVLRDGGIRSHVRYSLLGREGGWLSTAGSYGSRDGDRTSFVEWADAWWEPGARLPGVDSSGGAFAPQVSALGRLGFVSTFADFPVEYLDESLCVFVFPLSGTRIAAVRAGGALDPWREEGRGAVARGGDAR